jgi:hypothetical protein
VFMSTDLNRRVKPSSPCVPATDYLMPDSLQRCATIALRLASTPLYAYMIIRHSPRVGDRVLATRFRDDVLVDRT